MRRLGLVLGLILLVGAVGAAVVLGLGHVLGGGAGAVSIGSLWYQIHPNSLVGTQGLVERNVGPEAWAYVQEVFVAPAWLTLGLPGLVLALLCRPRAR
jgi:hypothetical protein